MIYQHKDLASGGWSRLSFLEQMANVGSEVNRALNWQKKGKIDFSQKAVARALELINLSLDSLKEFSRIKECCRLREAIVDYFYGSNQFSSSEMLWRRYFDQFGYIVRKNH